MTKVWIRASGLAVGVAVVGLSIAVPVTLGLALPQSDVGSAVGLAPIHEARANALAATAATDGNDRAEAVAETRRSLAQAPANATAWLRLAYLHSLGPSGLTTEGDRALAASYAVAPYGPDATPWRLAFALNHWPELSNETRQAALEELRVSTTAQVRRQLLETVSNPAGRLALILSSQSIERAELGSST